MPLSTHTRPRTSDDRGSGAQPRSAGWTASRYRWLVLIVPAVLVAVAMLTALVGLGPFGGFGRRESGPVPEHGLSTNTVALLRWNHSPGMAWMFDQPDPRIGQLLQGRTVSALSGLTTADGTSITSVFDGQAWAGAQQGVALVRVGGSDSVVAVAGLADEQAARSALTTLASAHLMSWAIRDQAVVVGVSADAVSAATTGDDLATSAGFTDPTAGLADQRVGVVWADVSGLPADGSGVQVPWLSAFLSSPLGVAGRGQLAAAITVNAGALQLDGVITALHTAGSASNDDAASADVGPMLNTAPATTSWVVAGTNWQGPAAANWDQFAHIDPGHFASTITAAGVDPSDGAALLGSTAMLAVTTPSAGDNGFLYRAKTVLTPGPIVAANALAGSPSWRSLLPSGGNYSLGGKPLVVPTTDGVAIASNLALVSTPGALTGTDLYQQVMPPVQNASLAWFADLQAAPGARGLLSPSSDGGDHANLQQQRIGVGAVLHPDGTFTARIGAGQAAAPDPVQVGPTAPDQGPPVSVADLAPIPAGVAHVDLSVAYPPASDQQQADALAARLRADAHAAHTQAAQWPAPYAQLDASNWTHISSLLDGLGTFNSPNAVQAIAAPIATYVQQVRLATWWINALSLWGNDQAIQQLRERMQVLSDSGHDVSGLTHQIDVIATNGPAAQDATFRVLVPFVAADPRDRASVIYLAGVLPDAADAHIGDLSAATTQVADALASVPAPQSRTGK